jgi:hypothetical protein
MELQKFISESIKQICSGISDAKKEINPDQHGPISPQTTMGGGQEKICFDIAVTVSKDNKLNASGGIRIGSVGVGAKGESLNKEENIHRISFQVPFIPYKT